LAARKNDVREVYYKHKLICIIVYCVLCNKLIFHPLPSKLANKAFGGKGRGGESFGGRKIERKLKKSFTFFEKVLFIENDK
jgi:hypothetical protein